VGVIVSGVLKAPNRYGAHAVEELARAAGTNVHTLYRAAVVAGCWTESQVEGLLLRENRHGQPLSWSHFVVLAGVASTERRAALVEVALGEGLTVRELTAQIRLERGRIGRGTCVLVSRVVRTAERWSEAAVALHQELLAELDCAAGAPAGDDDSGPVALIERAIAAKERLKNVMERQLVDLRAERGRFTPRKGRPAGAGAGLLLAGFRPR
jgi:hypothetical protein